MKLCAYPGRRESKSPAAVLALTNPELISLKAHQRKLPGSRFSSGSFRLIGYGILAHRHRHPVPDSADRPELAPSPGR